jgi:hypothetical protein
MRARFLLCCESAAVDRRRNTLSVFHIIEDFNVPAFPVVVPQMCVVTLLQRAAEEPVEPPDLSLRIVLNQQELYRGPIEANFQGHLKVRWITEVRGLVIPGPGALVFSVHSGENQLGDWSIPVVNIGQPEVQPDLALADSVAEARRPVNPPNEVA